MAKALCEIKEELETLRDSSYLLGELTRLFIEDNNRIGSYNDEISSRISNGFSFINKMLDERYKSVQGDLERIK